MQTFYESANRDLNGRQGRGGRGRGPRPDYAGLECTLLRTYAKREDIEHFAPKFILFKKQMAESRF